MSKVLITGADGFIGSHLTEQLVHSGAEVRALAQYNSFNSWGWLDGLDSVKSHAEIVSGDVRDAAFCQKLMQGVDTVFHLASLIAIPYSYSAPQSYIDTNVTGALNLCQAAIDKGVTRFIHTSTSEVYGTAQYVPIDEKHPLQAQSPYSASKIAADSVAYSFYSARELPLTIVRPFNTYGPRQSARAFIPSVIIQLMNRDDIEVGDLTPTRDFNYVEDTCRGFMLLVDCLESVGKTVNIGSNTEISIANTMKKIADLMGKQVKATVADERVRPVNSEVFRLCCDNGLLRELTGYKPAVDLDSGIQKTIDWFSIPENLSKYKADIYNV